jgi:uncharacterized membrane protein
MGNQPYTATGRRFAVDTQAEIAGALYGRGIGAIIGTAFGFVWFGWAFSPFRHVPAAVLAAYFLAAVVLMAFAVRTARLGRRTMKAQGVLRSSFWEKRRKAMGIVVALEVVGCIIVLALVGAFHRPDWAAAGVSLVVGLHFLPLARIFESAACFWGGGLMIAWDILTVTALKSLNPTASACIVTGAILWAFAIYLLTWSFPLRASARDEGSPAL